MRSFIAPEGGIHYYFYMEDKEWSESALRTPRFDEEGV